ncbi:ATP-binding cassette domain-containing protein [Mycoplasmatota bacterium]|nr:ATP-binding cassette domain-containing protein [Mycoplasmatota bacterium]
MSIKIKDVSKVFVTAGIALNALDHINLEINNGGIIAIIGPARSGKSTLLSLLSGLEKVSEGHIEIDDQEITNMSEQDLINFRDKEIGFLYKHYKLLESTNIKNNILMKRKIDSKYIDLDEILGHVVLSHAVDKYPFQLANGEQQKVVIAREVINRPKYLFCDDPTGSFNKNVTIQVLDVLVKITRAYQMTCIITTQNEDLGVIADRIIHINDGQIIKDENNNDIKKPSEINWG